MLIKIESCALVLLYKQLKDWETNYRRGNIGIAAMLVNFLPTTTDVN